MTLDPVFVLAHEVTLAIDALAISAFFRGGGGVCQIVSPPILSSSTCSSPSSMLSSRIEGFCRGDGV